MRATAPPAAKEAMIWRAGSPATVVSWLLTRAPPVPPVSWIMATATAASRFLVTALS